MAEFAQDKLRERDRYDARAAGMLAARAPGGPSGAAAIPVEIRTPYTIYEQLIRQAAAPGSHVLDLCCGNGLHSLTAASLGAEVTVSDIAPHNVELTLQRATQAGLKLKGEVADAENLPWPDGVFDVVTCAGSLSYVDPDLFLREVLRLLRPGGAFVFVDSLNHNPVYRLNRWRHYRRGERSLSTLRRMPSLGTLQRIRRDFPDLEVSYHGIFSFLAPLLRVWGPERCAAWLDRADRQLPWLHRYAFKIVGIGHKPGGNG